MPSGGGGGGGKTFAVDCLDMAGDVLWSVAIWGTTYQPNPAEPIVVGPIIYFLGDRQEAATGTDPVHFWTGLNTSDGSEAVAIGGIGVGTSSVDLSQSLPFPDQVSRGTTGDNGLFFPPLRQANHFPGVGNFWQ